ncbi:AraC family transcriptional regulator [Fimbriiglobus ruber]|uniref:Transcriptional Regulator, AraC family protein n=1 Tax=Fimbriiglobus ruber TaxID=1908690 RepID=A0A225E3Q5_9BACT|nr:AraC family transcriptional regulator [Fimbriiglobus ruber]OWK43027.1 Transcriptional Regulator, AraC family protein [Fimbriiglobus ruber]
MPKTRPVPALWREEVFHAAPGLAAAETLFDSLPDALFCVKDRDRRYVAANTAFVRAAGRRTRAELLGRTAREVFPAALAAGYEQQDDQVLSEGTAVHDRLEMVTRQDGGIGWFVSQKLPVRDAGGRIVALAGISRDLGTPAAQGGSLDPLAAALDTLHRDYAAPLRIGVLAKKAGLSNSQFQRRVSEMTGLTPRQLLTKARVEAAALALRGGDEPLGELAARCGFYDQAALSRQFRAYTGLSPGEYRRAFRA